MTDSNTTKPFIPADKTMPELSPFAIILGIILSIVFGGANAYLGLRVGMTVSASIPAAVISMGIIRGILKRDSILENNIVQTIGSAGESLAAGAIFTIPALFLWYKEWGMGSPKYLLITVTAFIGGVLGVLFMIPLRRALIVREHETLPFPEGTACAEVLRAGEEGGDKAKTTFIGLGVGALYKLLCDGIKIFPSEVDWAIPKLKGSGIGADVLPALLGVGYIIGGRISSYLFAGAILGWFVIMPLISFFGTYIPEVIAPASAMISELDHWDLWGSYLRYIGAGAVAFGGIYSLIRELPTIIRTFKESMKGLKKKEEASKVRTDLDLNLKIVIIVALVLVLVMGVTPIVPVGIGGAIIVAVFGFFFSSVAARIVGLVGSSNSPVSGMTIATLLVTAFIFKASGNDGRAGMIATIAVGSIICIITAISGDTSQDLKTGFLVGSTPRKQQIGELVGVSASALAIGGILILLNNAWGFGSKEIAAPQAMLMKLVVEGVMGGDLPWVLVIVGCGIGLVLAILGLPILPIAIGLYLPIHTSAPIMIGGLLHELVAKGKKNSAMESGILFSSGLIAGEGFIGILLAIFAVAGVPIAIKADGTVLGQFASVIAFAILILIVLKFSIWKKANKNGLKVS
ncbi:MAG: oligopeptide transporter, OPT family [Lachnospiraceae bacterium]|jgi:putative OPT family oligopeptide transporter|nr:oligopeptide transporter, OPT family [Lachnospiraceae bacterium]